MEDAHSQTMASTTASPPASSVTSPLLRPDSPSPSVSPSLALDAVPRLDRSVSTPSSSSVSELSTRSRRLSRLSSDGGTTVVKRRGYMRPQGTAFADSARNRDSVMSLGSIAHMQYYFARTGLLDGKGAQLAKDKERKKSSTYNKENLDPSSMSGSAIDDFAISSLSLNDTSSAYAPSDCGQDVSVVESPTELTEATDYFRSTAPEPPMLPPTVSTYKQKPSYTEPLPDMPVLRRELKEALQDACKVLEETQKQTPSPPQPSPNPEDGSMTDDNAGFHELQGLHLLDIITLAIRAAKNYYTAHTSPQKLYAMRSERSIRADLYNVLDVLKRMASRNFRGGMRMMELTEIILWIESIDTLIKREEQAEQNEAREREAMVWREGEWEGREREREWLFLKSFDNEEVVLPEWTQPVEGEAMPTAFLEALADGQRLVKLHNALVARSKRTFGAIKTWHSDVGKPYRRAENLRFWVKASELRWEIKLDVPVADVVNNKGEEAWKKFDAAVLKWCQGVREELTEEWRQEAALEKRRAPLLRVETDADAVEARFEDAMSTIAQTTAADTGIGRPEAIGAN
ncbi:uncharacterized protein LTR77_006427 [Saxophila tyrrhenica]|uniref:Uncharacterized protein n=1 Tax=Saxophila tyrrhenica TaxID=1690608 RepID=A0AAV9P7U8_9PEZI|nr:hypothetical protein LTR77_006427 [Saxophila tyrrhenica]